MSIVGDALLWLLDLADQLILVYFIAINTAYLVLITLAAGVFVRHVRRTPVAGADDLFRSPLAPSVSLIVPAFNEGPVIVSSVQALLALRYPRFDVTVVDDGSTDDTFEALRTAFDLVEIPHVDPTGLQYRGAVRSLHVARNDPDGLRVVRKANGGKADALNVGIAMAGQDLVCVVDADSVMDNDALLRLVRPYADDPTRVVAVGGVVRIANGSRIEAGRVVDVRMPRQWLVRIQIVEYLRAFLTGRTGWSRLGGLVVISGACGLFRRDVVLDIGGMQLDTVGEDAELVVRMHRRLREARSDYKVVFAADPVAWTQAPDTLRILGRQRRRWHRGLTEVLMRHRRMIGNPRYGRIGLVALPFYVLFELAAPVIELLALILIPVSLVLGIVDVQFAWHFMLVAYGYGILVTLCAVVLEEASFSRYRRWTDLARGLPAAVLENLGYRQALAGFQLQGIWQALRRKRGAWGTMTRVGHADTARRRHPARTSALAGATAAAVALAVVLVVVRPFGPAADTADPNLGEQIAMLGTQDLPTSPPAGSSWAPSPLTVEGLQVNAQAGPTGFFLHTAGADRTFLPGVDVGASTPGHEPGELAVSASDYRRWFDVMGRMGIRVVRDYTIHPPAFYDELAAYNRRWPDQPLYLVQGVYLPDESYVQKGNLYDSAVTDAFDAELRDASAAVSGDLVREPAPGRASGTWTTDVSPWLIGWIIGVEWDGTAVEASDALNQSAPAGGGDLFHSTPDASPTERWLATRMNLLATDEVTRGRSSPIAFVNWPTADPLTHPLEPNPLEDLAGVDAEHVLPTSAWPGGTFASFHAYPYYPDFQRYEFPGSSDPYGAYLASLRDHYTHMPVVISEFGVPSSIGTAHYGPLGRGQGDHDEQEAMTMDADMLRLIRQQGLAGGFVFSWTDEWFKATWNTQTHQYPPGRRPFWHDELTNEQYFGIVATDPLGPPDDAPAALPVDPATGPADGASWWMDESYLHLSIDLSSADVSQLTVGLDSLPALTGEPPPGAGDRRPDTAFALELGTRTGQAWVRRQLDPLVLDYQVPADARDATVPGWWPYQLVVNRALTVPGIGPQPLELFDAGALRYGTFDVSAPEFDSRATWHADGSKLELRIPWALAGFSDPSSAQMLVPDGTTPASQTSPGITVVLSSAGVDQTLGTIPAPSWDEVRYAERLKTSADTLRLAFLDTGS
ncbi:glycosyltransferase family 2 protein [Cellulomonas sp. URHD0024]|uniref:glycosyltransferase family 2 protein n=1 Tax=Cellulomonas sp. URHD0024 TaxID=1302620 RepID=UPI00040AE2E5|nr:glycosyltransferase [Cellulomonas sp. URHD0024]